MTYPPATLTWTATNERAITVAGTNATIPELLVAIKAALDNDATLWQASDYNAGNGTLEIKRKGAPTGEQATVRILIFGGVSPNSAALGSLVSAGTTNLYGALSVDANTTGPTASYTTAAPYSTKYVRGDIFCTNASIGVAASPRVYLMESVDGLAICIHSTVNCGTFIAGYIVDDVQNSTTHWGIIGSTGTFTTATSDITNNGQGTPTAVPVAYGGGGNGGHYWNSISLSERRMGRVNGLVSSTTNPVAGSSGAAATLMPIMMVDGAESGSPTWGFLGYLRQIRLGPVGLPAQTMRNAAGVQQAINFGVPFAATGYGVWFDQVA